jgi:hypothetical protein
MNYKMKGFITQIDEIKQLDNGAKIVTYRINNEEPYNNIVQFEMYKKPEYAEHADNFVKFNKVGDRVEVEFNIGSREYEGKMYTSLKHWKLEKLTNEENAIQQSEFEQTLVDDDDLPF